MRPFHGLVAMGLALGLVLPHPPARPGAKWVVVAARDLHPGVPIAADDVMVVLVPDAFPAPAAVSSAEVVGRAPWERILANEAVSARRLADPPRGQGLNARAPRGGAALVVRYQGGTIGPLEWVEIFDTAGVPTAVMSAQVLMSRECGPDVRCAALAVSGDQARQLAASGTFALRHHPGGPPRPPPAVQPAPSCRPCTERARHNGCFQVKLLRGGLVCWVDENGLHCGPDGSGRTRRLQAR